MSSIRKRIEVTLAEHVKKALTTAETAPKQKHIRECILYCWEHRSCADFWVNLKMQPIIHDPLGAFKALIVIHKLLMGGPPVVLAESYRERQFLDTCIRRFVASGNGSGYGSLIQTYVSFLRDKLEFHHRFQEFTGNFDFECYAKAKGIREVNEGYQVICELMDLQQKLDQLQRSQSVGTSYAMDCRVALFVPIVEESYGIYNFITSFLTFLFSSCSNTEPLVPLRERYVEQFFTLKRFYDDCRKIPQLTSLIAIPALPDSPPIEFRPRGRSSNGVATFSGYKTPEPINNEKLLLQQYLQQITSSQAQLKENQLTLTQYSAKIEELEITVRTLTLRLSSRDEQTEAQIRSLHEQVESWKSKYEALLNAFQKLQFEHSEMIARFTEEQNAQSALANDQMRRMKEEIFHLSNENKRIAMESDRLIQSLKVDLSRAMQELANSAELKKAVVLASEREQSARSRIERLLYEKDDLATELATFRANALSIESRDSDRERRLDELQKMLEEERENRSQLERTFEDAQRTLTTAEDSIGASFMEQLKERELVYEAIFTECFSSRIRQSVDDFENLAQSGNTLATIQTTLLFYESLFSSAEAVDVRLRSSDARDYGSLIAAVNDFCSAFNLFSLSLKGVIRNDGTIDVETFFPQILDLSLILCSFLEQQTTLASLKEVLSRGLDNLRHFQGYTDGLNASQSTRGQTISEFVGNQLSESFKLIQESLCSLLELQQSLSLSIKVDGAHSVSAVIIEGALAITRAIENLIKAASVVEREIVLNGKGTGSADAFYKKNHRWTEGLISAAKMVGQSTKVLIETADNIIKNDGEIDQVVVAAKDVSASTVQLVAAARVKTARDSKAQAELEEAARLVAEGVRVLVESVEQLQVVAKRAAIDCSEFSAQQLKVEVMNQKVKILGLEKALIDARRDLGEMQRAGYHGDVL